MSDPDSRTGPSQIGRYTIRKVLGRGAMGAIYQAHDPVIDRPVAIKLIRTDLLGGDEQADFITRFRREAQAAGRCKHANIVAIYDFAVHEGNPFLVMEFIDGVTLGQAWPASGRFPVGEAIALALEVLAALTALHGVGIIHRDIKPANIMLESGRRVKVTDFGIAHLDTAHITQSPSVIGTPSYMAPEQCRGEAVDARSDLFSTAAVLFEMLSGQKPFPGRNTAEVFAKLLYEPAPDLRVLVPDLPPGLADLVARGLAKAPGERFATAAEMAASLQAVAMQVPEEDRTIILPARPWPAAAAEEDQTIAASGAVALAGSGTRFSLPVTPLVVASVPVDPPPVPAAVPRARRGAGRVFGIGLVVLAASGAAWWFTGAKVPAWLEPLRAPARPGASTQTPAPRDPAPIPTIPPASGQATPQTLPQNTPRTTDPPPRRSDPVPPDPLPPRAAPQRPNPLPPRPAPQRPDPVPPRPAQ